MLLKIEQVEGKEPGDLVVYYLQADLVEFHNFFNRHRSPSDVNDLLINAANSSTEL